jgi:undecaprenyl-diphosphatase
LSTTQRRRDAALATVAFAAYGALGEWVARAAPRWDQSAFLAVNRSRGSRLLRLPQQLGTPWVLPLVSLGAAWRGRRELALAAGAALPVEKGCEVAVKKATFRKRPGLQVRTALRDDAPVFGSSYPSGHVAIGVCAVTLLAPYVGPAWTTLLSGGVVATGYTRVHQGAHYPLDAVGGAALGVAVAASATAVVGRPSRSSTSLTT